MVHRPDLSFLRKQAVIINTAAGGGMRSTVRDIKDSTENLGIARTHCLSQSVWNYAWNDLPESFQKSIRRKVQRTAKKVRHHAKHLTPSFKVRCLFTLYRFLHKHQKMTPVDDIYWQKQGTIQERPENAITGSLFDCLLPSPTIQISSYRTLFSFLPLQSVLPPHQTPPADNSPSTLFLLFPAF